MPTYLTEAIGWIACVLEVYAFQEKTMIPLRVAAVFACLFGFAYGYLTPCLSQHGGLASRCCRSICGG